jgi:uncharacterized protein
MRHEDVSFPGTHGTLSGVVDRPDKEPEAVALFAHCFTGGKAHPAARRISRALARRGLAVLRYDFTGLGESEGSFAEATFSTNVEDLVLAAEHLAGTYGAPSLLLGHSLGGAAALAAAARLPDVEAVATVAAPADPMHVTHLFADSLEEIRRQGQAEVELAGRRFVIGHDFVADLAEQRQLQRIRDLGRPLLVLHSPDDELVGVEEAGKIFGAAQHPRSFVALDGADHLLTGVHDARRVAQLVAAWADPYLPESFTPEAD